MTQETKSVLIQFKGEATNLLQTEKKVTEETKKLSREFQKVGKANKNFGNQFQNIGYQLQDFAVQVGGGTDAMRAFSQQAPQLLSPLGNIGIAAATAVAVLVPLAKAIFDSGDAAEKTAKELDAFKATLEAIGSTSSGPIGELVKALEAADTATQDWIFSLLRLRQGDVASAIEQTQEKLNDYIVELTRYTDTASNSVLSLSAGIKRLSGDAAALEGISEKLNVDADVAAEILTLVNAFKQGTLNAIEFATALNGLAEAGKIDSAAIEPLETLLNTLVELEGTAKSLSPALEKVTVKVKKLTETDLDPGGWKKFSEAIKDSVDPARVYYRELDKIRTAYSLRLLEADEYAKAVSNLQDKFLQVVEVPNRKLKKPLEETKSLVEEIKEATRGWADTFANDVVNGLEEGKFAFKDFADYVLKQLARIALSKALEPLFNGFGDWIDGITGAAAPVPTGLIAVPANDLPISREMSAAQPMIVGVPRMSAPSSASSPVTVNVYNQGSNEVEVNERKTTRGVEVDVLIKNAVKKGIAAGDFDKVMATSYGARRMAF